MRFLLLYVMIDWLHVQIATSANRNLTGTWGGTTILYPISMYDPNNTEHVHLNFIVEGDMIISGADLQNSIFVTQGKRQLIRARTSIMDQIQGHPHKNQGSQYSWSNFKGWPNPQKIPYRFDEAQLTSENFIRFKDQVFKSVDQIQLNTCIRYHYYQRASEDSEPYIVVMRSPEYGECYATVPIYGVSGRLHLVLGDGCFSDIRMLYSLHEFMHTLGVVHGQSRQSADKYLKTFFDNIHNISQPNYRVDRMLPDDTPFDYGSVMQYGARGFINKPDAVTLMPKDINFLRVMGQRLDVAFYDWKRLNRFYCNNECTGSSLDCLHEGYPNPNDCSVCKCPYPFVGQLCNQLERSDSHCPNRHRLLKAIPLVQYIEIGLHESNKQECFWLIEAPQGKRIMVDISKEPKHPCRKKEYSYCIRNFVEVKYDTNLARMGARISQEMYKSAVDQQCVVYPSFVTVCKNESATASCSDVTLVCTCPPSKSATGVLASGVMKKPIAKLIGLRVASKVIQRRRNKGKGILGQRNSANSQSQNDGDLSNGGILQSN